ncbi:hypothetical protein [Roseibium marinum]|uniref:Sphingomyelin phosphodiesterase C-terminal domain-containing protein n=1 Tax=Roseibium marinum TaxID=281252 RepID=A0A2S3UK11_9HYPH|nr:hypothetical protein [Roseibium marinum]POF28005.1 hypothetical protein CLV41_1189 [Roseibium marinum]
MPNRIAFALTDSARFCLSNLAATAKGALPNRQVEYVYRGTYAIADLMPASRATLAARLESDATLRKRFSELYAVTAQGTDQIDTSNWQAYTCAQTALGQDAYEACYCAGK